MDDPDVRDICFPLKDLKSILGWKCDEKCWIHKHDVFDVRPKSIYSSCGGILDVRGSVDLFSEYKWSTSIVPKTIFCHDYKGGYQEDRFCNGSKNINTYRFFNWAGIDLFIYFSHYLVTIPTQGWLNAGHLHGVPVLGTIITESHEGKAIWKDVLSDVQKINLFSQKLAEVCAHFKFDGYLLNVENEIEEDKVFGLVQFVSLLKTHLNLYCKNRQTWVIWYDSVTTNGKLDWQNKLCLQNKPFFDACDGIFLNYNWNPSDILESIEVAGSRKFDVFVGIDVFGRNCYQDGGFSVDKAMAVLRSMQMSVALFALGWTFEKCRADDVFLIREITFWKTFWPYLYIHGPAQLPFSTNFCQGVTFDKKTRQPLFNLGMQQYQPTAQDCCAKLRAEGSPLRGCVSLYLNVGISQACLKIQATHPDHVKLFHRVFVCDFGNQSEESIALCITLDLKRHQLNPASKFRIYFVLEDKTSIEGKTHVSMRTKPKGYRASCTVESLRVSGSVVDFTAEKPTERSKIRVLPKTKHLDSSWCQVKFMLELSPNTSLTEILLLPPPEGAVLWGLFGIEDTSIANQPSAVNI